MNDALPKAGVIEIPREHFSREEERAGSTSVVPAGASPMAMVANAVQRNMDPATITKLMDLAERFEKNEALKAYNDALASFKAEAVEIIKRKRVHFQTAKGVTDYKHAELSDVIEAVGPALSRNGFAWGWKTKQDKGWIEVTCELRHRLGHMEVVTLGAPPDETGGKNTVQAIVSTVSYLERHTLKAVCGVAEKGDDKADGRKLPDAGGGGDPERMSEQDYQAWVKKIRATTTKEAAKEVWHEAVKAAKALDDLATAEDLKGILKEHGEFIDKAGR